MSPLMSVVIERCRVLLSERGTIFGRSLAAEMLAAYHGLSEAERPAFFDFLGTLSAPIGETARLSARTYAESGTRANLVQLRRALASPCEELFTRLNLAPGGTAALIDMRRMLLDGLPAHEAWGAVEAELAALLRSWFNAGFLELRRIDWRTSAQVLERLMQHEAVHAIRGWGDLRRRLEADRRCFALFHPALPDEPLAFTEIALSRGLVADVGTLLDPAAPVLDPASGRWVIFYSISSCHDGLRGVPFGNVLIRRVLDALTIELPHLEHFATVSPVPGFRAWLAGVVERVALPRADVGAVVAALETPGWLSDPQQSAGLKAALLPLCAWYLLHAKRGTEPADPVARFHLNNGACVERLNWMGDASAAGIRRSWGLTANYVYRVAEIHAHHEAYVTTHDVAASAEVRRLADVASAHLDAIPA